MGINCEEKSLTKEIGVCQLTEAFVIDEKYY